MGREHWGVPLGIECPAQKGWDSHVTSCSPGLIGSHKMNQGLDGCWGQGSLKVARFKTTTPIERVRDSFAVAAGMPGTRERGVQERALGSESGPMTGPWEGWGHGRRRVKSLLTSRGPAENDRGLAEGVA